MEAQTEKIREMFNKELEHLKNKQRCTIETKKTVAKINKTTSWFFEKIKLINH